MSESFFTNLTPYSLILTPNRRLCGFIENEYKQFKLDEKISTWPALNIQPFNLWLETLWQKNFTETKTVLTEAQQLHIYKQIIEEYTPELLKINAAAKQAIEAMRLLTLWDIPMEASVFTSHRDSQEFYSWYEVYSAKCLERHCIDKPSLAKAIIDNFQSFQTQIEKIDQITLIGFDEVSPLWQALLTQCQTVTKLNHFDFKKTPKQVTRYEFTDFKDELQHAVAWMKSENEKNSDINIACVIPNLSNHRAYIEKTFMKVFSAQKFMQLQDKDELPFNISAGQALSSFAIVKTALSLLKLKETTVSLEEAKLLLRSPFIIGYYKESIKRARLDFKISNFNYSRISTEFFLNLLMEHCPILYLHYYKFSQLKSNHDNSLFSWAEFFNKKLELIGWPGERELSSQNYQLIASFKDVFNQLLSLNADIKQCNKNTALELINTLADDSLFQIKTGTKPIQVLGALEAAGMTFDKLWLMQCNSHVWPAPANPNPFIPQILQRDFALPHASADRELTFAKTLFARFKNSSAELYLSSAKEENNQELNLSFLVEDIELSNHDIDISDPIQVIQKASDLELFEDKQSLAVTKEEQKQLRGGTGILAAQAACPFKAFASYRLQACSAAMPQPGLTALERGEIIHSALELFWQRVHSLEAYNLLTETECRNLEKQCAEAAVLAIDAHLYQAAPRLFAIEAERVIKIMQAWLKLETERDAFSVIATEQMIKTTFEDLPLNLRIDRIDKLENGALILIDYKTGLTSPTRWFGERIDEPQLPLYALIYPKAIDAIMFGQVRNNEFAIKGIGSELAESAHIKNIAKVSQTEALNWEEIKALWQQELSLTAKAFLNGCADINPKYAAQTCNFCELASLCRIEELTNGY